MRARRGLDRLEDLCSGPGRLTQALGIGLDVNATDLSTGPIRLEPRPRTWRERVLATAPRVGVTKAVELPWRFTVDGSRFVSRPRPAGARANAA
jgi:DNA-3-methyladenine glycosylase